MVIGIGLGLTYGFIYALFAAGFIFGVHLMLEDDGMSAGDILVVSGPNQLTFYMICRFESLSCLFPVFLFPAARSLLHWICLP